MFIDERNQIQFESIEELKANKEYAIKEILNWEMPTVEELAEEMANNFVESIRLGLIISVDDIVDGIHLAEAGLDQAQLIIDEALQNEEASAKMKAYFKRANQACELVISELNKN